MLEHLSAWVIKLHDDLGNGQIPKGIIAFLSGHSDASGLGNSVTEIEQHISGLEKELHRAPEVTGMQTENTKSSVRTQGLTRLGKYLQLWQDNLNALLPDSAF